MKSLLKNLDRTLTGGALLRGINARRRRRFRTDVDAPFDAAMQIGYPRAGFSRELASLCDRYGSDKGEAAAITQPYAWPSHLYTDLYEMLFGQAREAVKLVVECGIGTDNPELVSSMGVAGKPGASLRVWRDYFPNARVVGADIDPAILFAENRIETFQCDQTCTESVANFRDNAGLGESSIDLVIDDGLHEYHAGIAFFESMWPALRRGGTHIIEDIVELDAAKFARYLADLPEGASGMLVDITSGTLPLSYNMMAVIRKTSA